MHKKSLPLIGCIVVAHLFVFLVHIKMAPRSRPKKSILIHTFSAPSTPRPHVSDSMCFAQPCTPTSRIDTIKTPPSIAPKNNRRGSKGPLHLEKCQKKKEILKNVKQSLKKIESLSMCEQKENLTLTLSPLHLDIDQKESNQTGETGGYLALLSHFLQEALELPEHGHVKLALTIDNSGDVLNIKVLESASDTNRTYLEYALSNMTFPPFGDDLKWDNQRTWVVTFCNEM